MSPKQKTFLFCTTLVLFAIVIRIVSLENSWHNFATMGAVGLFSGVIFRNKPYAIVLPILAFLVTDFYIQKTGGVGFYGITQYFVYGSMAVIVLFGGFMKRISVLSVLGFALGSSMIFFLVSNFGVWFAGCLVTDASIGSSYAKNLSGLISCYEMGIPFYKYTLASDLFFSGVLFGAYSLFRLVQKQKIVVKAA